MDIKNKRQSRLTTYLLTLKFKYYEKIISQKYPFDGFEKNIGIKKTHILTHFHRNITRILQKYCSTTYFLAKIFLSMFLNNVF